MTQSIDILAFAAHPDDVELSACGTLLTHKKQGYSTGIIDLSGGELGTRGTKETRKEEAENAASILQLDVRENLGLKDGFFEITEESLLAVVQVIRKYKPKIVLANALSDRHPDHSRGAELVARASFLAGLVKIKTNIEGNEQDPYRPQNLYHYVQDEYQSPDLVVDISSEFETKMEAIKAFKTQFYQGSNDNEPVTPISSEDFIHFIEARARELGRSIGVQYGEGFVKKTPIRTTNLLSLI